MIIYPSGAMNALFMRIIPRSEIETRLSDAGLEMTPQRFVVLEYLVRSNEAHTLDEILEKLQRLYPRPSHETVQRALQILCDSGLICAETWADHSTRYRLRFDPLNPPLSGELEDD